MRSVIFALLLNSGLVGWATAAQPKAVSSIQPKDVSMVQLIADPKRFDGETVRVIGYLHLEFEGNAVYLHREDFERSIPQNGIWIELTEAQQKSSTKLNNGYVLVEGTFSASEKGHLDIWPGSLQRVSRVSNWSVDRNQRARR